jgi:hypothetical protein
MVNCFIFSLCISLWPFGNYYHGQCEGSIQVYHFCVEQPGTSMSLIKMSIFTWWSYNLNFWHTILPLWLDLFFHFSSDSLFPIPTHALISHNFILEALKYIWISVGITTLILLPFLGIFWLPLLLLLCQINFIINALEFLLGWWWIYKLTYRHFYDILFP